MFRAPLAPAVVASFVLALAACSESGPSDGDFAGVVPAYRSHGETFGGYPSARAGGNYMHNYYIPPAPSSTPWYPAWHPDGERVAVSMMGSIWEIDLAEGRAREIVHGPAYYSSPDYSPDGRWLVFTADDHGRSVNLGLLDLETEAWSALTAGTEVHADPRFSPDGTRIAFVSTAPSGYFNVYVGGVEDGGFAGEPEAVTTDNDFGRNRLYFSRWDFHTQPAWLPDGDELLLVSNRDIALGSGNVFRVPARAGGFAERRTVLREQTLYRTRPDVSPDGRRFVFSSTRGSADEFNNLYVQPTTEGGEPYKLTFYRHDAFHPRFSPDGERIAYIDNRDGLPQLKLLDTYGGRVVDVEIAELGWARPTERLSVRVLGPEGGPTPARIHLTASDGRFYAPSDAYARIGQRGGTWHFHTEGEFAMDLPLGETVITASKGFEHMPVTVAVSPEAEGEAEMELERIADLTARGWYNGSTHLHMNYGGNFFNTLENMMTMSRAEDQDIVLNQIANKDNRVLDHRFFVPGGGAHPLSEPDLPLVVGQEYRPPFYGHVFMFGMRDHLISPYATGYEGTAIESIYPSNTDMFRKAREQGAWTGYVHSFFRGDPLETGLGGAKGFMVDAALGVIDAIEWSQAQDGFPPVYAAWNNGLRVTLVGGEDAISDLHTSLTVGSYRTYVKTANGELSVAGWFDAMRAGHAFATSGPLVDFTVEGRISGETVGLRGGEEVSLSLEVSSITPLVRAEIVFNGEVVEEVVPEEDSRRLAWSGRMMPPGSGWYHVRVAGEPEDRYPLDINYAQAVTNPVWVIVDDEPVRSVEAAEYSLEWIDRLQAMAEIWPGWRSDAEKAHVFGQFDEAREVYQGFRREAGR